MTSNGHMIFFDPKKRRKGVFRVSILVVAGLFMFGVVSILSSVFIGAPENEQVKRHEAAIAYYYYHLPIHKNKIALTFDDGPNPALTSAVLDVLKEEQVPGTFFMVGSNIAKYPEIAKRVHDEGHVIGNHTYTHQHTVQKSHARIALELRITEITIKNATGVTPLLYRPPFLLEIGNDATINPDYPAGKGAYWALTEGYLPVGADIDPKDWLSSDPKEIETRFFEELQKGGHIALLHDGPAEHRFARVNALPEIIEKSKAAGYTFVPATELFAPSKPITFSNTLAIGSTGPEVSLLQWFLFSKGYTDQYGITGTFSESTAEALRAFQVRHSLTATGVLDLSTRSAIIDTPLDSLAFIHTERPTTGEQIASAAFAYPRFLIALAGFALILALIRILFLIAALMQPKKQYQNDPSATVQGVTVVIPAYNESANVAATIRSVIENTYTGPMEILVIDDGSSDDTAAFVRETARGAHVPITLIRKHNGGKARALNLGFGAAKYDIIVALDGDIILDKKAIHHLLQPFVDPRVAAVAGKVYTAGRNDLIDRFQRIEYITGQNIEKEALGRLSAISVVPGAVGAWRKQAVLSAGGHTNDTLVEDQDLTLMLLSLGYHVRYAAEAIAYTETPHTVRDFLKQRFRWVYGSFQCFWKYKSMMIKGQGTPLGTIVLPMMLFYGVFLPLMYPILDTALLLGLMSGQYLTLFYTAVAYTVLDLLYVFIALLGEPKKHRNLLFYVPLQRVFYRPVMWFVVVKSLVKAIEGTLGAVSLAAWNRVMKQGDAAKFYSGINDPVPKN